MEAIDLITITGSSFVGALIISTFFWKLINKRFDKVDVRLDKIDEDLRNIRERTAVMEAETIMYNMIPDESKRSEAAKKMWERRRQKRLSDKTKS